MGWMAAVAGLAFGLAMVMLATFFKTRDTRFDRVAEWSFILFAVLLVPTIRAVVDRMSTAGPELLGIAITVIGLAGALSLGVAELATTLRLVDFRRVSALTTIAFFAILVWIGVVSLVVALSSTSPLPAPLGWLGIVSIGVAVAIVVSITRTPGVMTGAVEPDPGMMTAFFVPMAGIIAWMVWLGLLL